MKAEAADCQVREQLGFPPDGERKNVVVHLRKTGYNTPYVTEQWFCLHLPCKSALDFAAFQLAGCDILAAARSALFNQVVSQCLAQLGSARLLNGATPCN